MPKLSIHAAYRSGIDVGHLDKVYRIPEPSTSAMVRAALMGMIRDAARQGQGVSLTNRMPAQLAPV
jgi:hypothetical protein